MIKRSIQEENITIVSIYEPNIGAPQYIKQALTGIRGKIITNTIIVGDVNIPLTPMDKSSIQRISKEMQILNETLDVMDLIYIFSTFHPNTEEYIFFSSAHGTFSRIDHVLGHKSSLSKFKKIEIISSIFSDHNAMRLDINYKGKKMVKNTNTWRLNNMFLNNQQVTDESKKEIKKFLETNDNENTITQSLWDTEKSSSKKEVYSNTILSQETRKTSNRKSNFSPKTTGKKEQKSCTISRRKEINI